MTAARHASRGEERPAIVEPLDGRRRCVAAGLLTCALAATGVAPAAAQSEARTDVCRTQIVEDVAERFQQTVTNINFRHVFERRDIMRLRFGQAIVSVEECPGFHFYEVRATDFTCERQAHLGEVPQYVFYRSSGDGC